MVSRIQSPVPRSTYVHRDTRYVAEFVTVAFPGDPKMFNVRLGPTPLELAHQYPDIDVDRWARVWAKTADAIVLTPSHLIVIEGELRRPVLALGELLVYRELVAQTESLGQYRNMAVRTLLLTPLPDPTIRPVLDHLGIEVIEYRPLWVEGYLRQVGRI